MRAVKVCGSCTYVVLSIISLEIAPISSVVVVSGKLLFSVLQELQNLDVSLSSFACSVL